jgi:hypothetical protein
VQVVEEALAEKTLLQPLFIAAEAAEEEVAI